MIDQATIRFFLELFIGAGVIVIVGLLAVKVTVATVKLK